MIGKYQKNTKQMKTKLAIAFTGLVACSLAFAQTNDNTAGASADAATNAPAEATANAATNTPAEATTNAMVEVSTNTAGTEPSPSTTAAATNVTVIPLIVMDDVPLTDAIKNLARQAGLNYMLDPKISYGQPDSKGVIAVQPTVSIRWENVTAEQALAALLNNYNFQLVMDPRTKIARVTVKDPTAPPALYTHIVQLKFASPSNVLAAVQSTFADPKRSKVVADTRTSQLVVVATEKELDAVDELVARLDAQTRQVLIEARLLETSINPATAKGINWAGTLQAQNLAFGNNLSTPISGSVNAPLSSVAPKLMFDTARGFNPATAFLDADGVKAVFSFFNQDAQAKVLSAPRTVTLDNELSHIAVTRASPIINVTPGTANTTGGSQITYTNLGVILDVTPRISANNFVNLKVEPEVSRIFDRVSVQVGSAGVFEADEYDVRKLTTHVMIPSGNTLVLGGLVQDDERFSSTKVPLMGDIPILGRAFRSNAKQRQKSNLLIFITPTIIQDSDYQPTTTDFLKAPLPKSDDTEWSAWDSTKPVDWSRPVVEQYKTSKYQGSN
jgi:type II secretory pathway component GspD/PulD (secretin)